MFLVRFTRTMQPSITLRDLVQSIPYTAIQMGLLTVERDASWRSRDCPT